VTALHCVSVLYRQCPSLPVPPSLSCPSLSLPASMDPQSGQYGLFDEKVPLDEDLRATFVTALLNCSPKHCPNVPPFRITELFTHCISAEVRRSSDLHVLESLLCFYTICVYFGLSTSYEASSALKALGYIMSCLSECIIIDVSTRGTSFEMGDLNTLLQRDDEIDPSQCLEPFQQALEIARLILRDCFTYCRAMSQAKTMREQAALPQTSDCLQPAAMLFAATFALCHVCMVLHSQSNLPLLPGVVDTLLVVISTRGSEQWVERARTLALLALHSICAPRETELLLLMKQRLAKRCRPQGRSQGIYISPSTLLYVYIVES
jgi:hypothetical protein